MLEIHKATLEDADELAAIMNEAHQFKLLQGDMAWETEPFTPEDMMHTIRKGTGYLAVIDNQPAARFVLDWEDEQGWGAEGLDGQAGYIHALAVRDAHRGQHLGEQIIAWCCNQIQAAGRPYARLDCPADNPKLCAYYEHLGFISQGANPSNHTLYQRLL